MKSSKSESRNTTLRFESLKDAHIPAILEIEKLSNSAPWSERSFRGELDNPQSVFIVALAEGRLIGYAGLWVVVDEAHVTTVAVEPEQRRKGIGKRLIVELLTRGQERGVVCATLEVRASNVPAIRLYEGLGFVQAAKRKGYYPDNREDAVVMWRYEL